MYELYRRSALGLALTDTLDELVRHHQLTPSMAMRVLVQFDKSINDIIVLSRSRGNIKSHLDTYRFCDDVWSFALTETNLRIEDEYITIPKLKIVACKK